MNKKTICVGIVIIFLLTVLTNVTAIETTKPALISSYLDDFRICIGKVTADEGNLIFNENSDFKDKPINIPHSEDVVIYVEYDVDDTIWGLSGNTWYFEITIIYTTFIKEGFKEVYDECGPDNSEKGTIELSFINEELKTGYESTFFVDYTFLILNDDLSEIVDYYIETNVQSGKVILENQKPSKPSITGPQTLKEGEIGEFKATSTDPEADNIEYGWDWDDDDLIDEWTDEYYSGDFCNVSKKWDENGEHTIRVKSRDTYKNNDKLESQWSDPFVIKIEEKSKIKENAVQSFLQRLLSSKFSFLFS